MAARFWVGGTGNWDASDTTHWSATSNGAGGASVPGSSDDVTFDASSGGGTVSVTATATALTITGGSFTGTFDTTSQTINSGTFNFSGTGTRTVTLGSSAINLTGTIAATINFSTNTNLTLTANTATFTLSGTTGGVTTAFNFNFNGSSIVMTGGSQQDLSGSGTMTMANFTRTGTATKGIVLNLTSNLTCTGTFNSTGQSAINRIIFKSSVLGTARTITAATVSVNATDLQDITGAGAGSWDLSGASNYSGDCGGNTSITFTTPATQTATGTSSFTWSTHGWTTRVPLPQDDVVINNAFSASQNVTMDMPRMGKSISFSGATGTPGFNINAGTNTMYGSLTLISAMTLAGNNGLTLAGRGSFTLTSAGKQFGTGTFSIAAPGGTYTLQDDLSLLGAFTHTNGTFLTGNFNITTTIFGGSGSSTRTLTLGSSTINLTTTAATTAWNMGTTTGLTFSGASATVVLSTVSTNTRTFSGGGLTYGTLTYTVTGSSGELDITGSNSFGTINFYDLG